jgi:hypothetical protein
MSRPPGEPLVRVTFNAYEADWLYLRSKHPMGGHLVFLQQLLHQWVRAMKQQEPTDG